jgi:hypothetical protein
VDVPDLVAQAAHTPALDGLRELAQD